MVPILLAVAAVFSLSLAATLTNPKAGVASTSTEEIQVASPEGESFTVTGKADIVNNLAYASGGAALRTYQGSVATKTITTTQVTRLVVVARKGAECAGKPPHITVSIDGSQALSTSVTATSLKGTAGEYSAAVSVASGAHTFTVKNDSTGSCDPPARFDVLRLYGPPVPAGSQVPPDSTKLTWAPPTCGDTVHSCQDLYLTETGSNQQPSLSSSVDYRIHLPATGPLVGGLQIRGGHNVIIIGGEIDLTYPCNDSSSACRGIYISKPTAGHVYVEGVLVNNPATIGSGCAYNSGASGFAKTPCSTSDGIAVNGNGTAINDLTFQNMRIDGISGCAQGSPDPADHADVFQPWAAPDARVHFDHFTGTTNCQGLNLDPDLAWTSYGKVATEYILKNVNIDELPPAYTSHKSGTKYWVSGGSCLSDKVAGSCPTGQTVQEGCGGGPITLSNVYASELSGNLGNATFPYQFSPSTCPSAWNSSAQQMSFLLPQVTGAINNGMPPGGDFVPIGVAGSGYVSPGYQ